MNGKKTLLKPTKIEFFSEKNLIIKKIICGSNFTFVLDGNDIPYSFGSNSNGQLARNTQGYEVNPFPDAAEYLVGLGQIRKICCGWSHGIMLNYNGEVFVWGNYFKDYQKVCNIDDIVIPKKVEIPIYDGIKGNYNNNSDKFEEINIDGENRNIIDIASGSNHLAILLLRNDKRTKELYTWGSNEFVNLNSY